MKCHIKFWGCYYCHYHIFGQEQSNMVLELDPTERKRAFLSDWLKNSPLKEVNHRSEQCHYSTISHSWHLIWTLGSKRGRTQIYFPREFGTNKCNIKMNQQVESLTLNYYLIHKHRLYSWAYVFKKIIYQQAPLLTEWTLDTWRT